MKTSFRQNQSSKRHFRRPYGIAVDYRIYQDEAPTPARGVSGVLIFTLISLMALLLLLGTKAMVKLGVILWRHYTAHLRANIFEWLYERQLLHRRYPRQLIEEYLPQIVENDLPVRIYCIDDRRIVRRCSGRLTVSGERYKLTANDTFPCYFTDQDVVNLFPAPQWLGEQVCITLHG